VVFAHRLIDSDVLAGGPVGETVAEYVFRYADGQTLSQPVRERFEIAVPSIGFRDLRGGQLPALALPDVHHTVPAREIGEFGLAGRRQTELRIPSPTTCFLWAWLNPRAEVPLQDVMIVPGPRRFVIAGITLGHADEHPLRASPPTLLRIELAEPVQATHEVDLSVEVDRGTAGFAYALPSRSSEHFLADTLVGFGEAANVSSSPAYVEIAAAPSATLTVQLANQTLARVPWRSLQDGATLETGGVRLLNVEPGRNWIRTRVIDGDTGAPVPCRIHFRTPEGIPFQPHGHHGHVNSNLDTWHLDVGGDVRLGQITYAYIDGTCEGWLPRGEVLVDVARGFEYAPLRARITIDPGQQALTLRLNRVRDMNAERWFSGDTHVHFLSTQGAHLEARGEDLNVVNLLLSQWGHLFTNAEDFIGAAVPASDKRTIVYASQENRQHFLGHLGLLGLTRPVMPWCSDGPMEAELSGTLETTLAHWADECHSQGGTVVLPHLPNPNGEPAALIATGRIDAVEMIEHHMYGHLEYYRYLNCGYRLPIVGGTDRMSNAVPVGLYRTYVRIPPDEEFSYEAWCRNLRKGRTFLSGGPLLSFSVEGHDIGDEIQLPASGGELYVEARATSLFPIHTLQVVERGQVAAATEDRRGARELRLRARLKIERNTWLAARAGGPDYERATPHRDIWARGIIAHTSPIYVACGSEWDLFEPVTAQYMLTLIDASLSYLREMTPQFPSGRTTHRHGEVDHQSYLERPFIEARAAVHGRIHRNDSR
jgi:hypothetical protein